MPCLLGLRARPREVSSRVLGLQSTYCTVHTAHEAFLHDLDLLKNISQFFRLQQFDFVIYLYHKICLSISFPTLYSKLFYRKTLRRYREKKKESCKTMAQLFFRIQISSNIFHDFLGCSFLIFKCFDIIRVVFLLAIQCCISNCFTTKTHKATMKIVHPSPVYYLCT